MCCIRGTDRVRATERFHGCSNDGDRNAGGGDWGAWAQILAVGRGLPEHYYSQEELIEAFLSVWGDEGDVRRRMTRLHGAVQVGGRHLALSVPEYLDLKTFGRANDAFIRVGTEVAEKAVSDALTQAGIHASEVDAIFFTTVTGLATPTIDARLVNRMGFRPDVKRTPLFGLGCVGGAAGVAPNDRLLAGVSGPLRIAHFGRALLINLAAQRPVDPKSNFEWSLW